MTSRSPELIAWMKAAGEPSRLRLLALCGQRDLSVTDLARALGQSEPRVSRHLKILCEAGLLERLRQGQWVHYRVSANARAAGFVQGLFGLLEPSDPVLALAREHEPWQAGTEAGQEARTCESRLGRAMGGFVDAGDRSVPTGAALVVGVEHLELLESAALKSTECTAIAHSRRALQSARAFAERRGFACRVLLAASTEGLTERDISRMGRMFDSVYLDHVAVPDTAFAGMLSAGKRVLAPNGHLWLFERYEALETPAGKVIEHPFAKLRRLLGDLGLSCERMSPIEADGEHIVAAAAAPMSSVSRGTGAAA